MTKFTKGPWFIERKWIIGPKSLVEDQTFGMIEEVCDVSHSMENRQANAHLIAAAPDLYEALDRLVGEIKDYHVSSSVLDAIEASIYAIAKALGEA